MDVVRKGLSAIEELLETAWRLPWWGAVLLAFACYIFLHPFAIMVVASPGNPESGTPFVSMQFYKGLAGTAQYLVPLLFLVISLLSTLFNRKRKK